MRDADSTGRYDVQLTGELLPGYDLDAAVEAIAALYRADQAHVAGLLAAAPCVCKSNVTRSRAGQHVRALKQAGAVAVVVPRRVERTTKRADTAAALPASTHGAPPELLPNGLADTVAAAELDPGASPEPEDAATREDGMPAVPEAAAVWDTDTLSSHRSPKAWPWMAVGMVMGFALGLGTAWLALPELTSENDKGLVAQPAMAAAAEPEPRPVQALKSAADVDAAATGIGAPIATEPDTLEEPEAPEQPDEPMEQRAAAVAGTGPFGLEPGMALADLDIAAAAPAPGRRLLASVPAPVPLIERTFAVVAPGTGLCGIEAQSQGIETAADGAALRAAFEQMAAEVDQRYGALERTDIRLSRAADPGEATWMQRLRSGEQRLMSIWSAPNESAEGLARITLTASAPADDRGLIRVEYRFASFDACMAELAATGVDHHADRLGR